MCNKINFHSKNARASILVTYQTSLIARILKNTFSQGMNSMCSSDGINKDLKIVKELDKIHNPRRILDFVLHKFQE